jgi:hypothetical protein
VSRGEEVVRVGCWAGAWGDTTHAAPQLLRGSGVDYLVADLLAPPAEWHQAFDHRPGTPGA